MQSRYVHNNISEDDSNDDNTGSGGGTSPTNRSSMLQRLQRPRRASFDNNHQRAGRIYLSKSDTHSIESARGIMSLLTMSRSSDDDDKNDDDDYTTTIEERSSSQRQHSSSSSNNNNHSLLTTFLLHLNSLLPEYCEHLSSTSSDTLQSIHNASKAVAVLERGAKTLESTTFGSRVENNDERNSKLNLYIFY